MADESYRDDVVAANDRPDGSKSDQQNQVSSRDDVGDLAQAIVRKGRKAYLATIDKATMHPIVTLVAVATEPDGQPIFLLSRLARHTHNLLQNPRASVLFDDTGKKGDPLAGDRVTVVGTMVAIEDTDQLSAARRRFLSCHPEAAQYADFSDFGFYRLFPDFAHLVGGFGRIVEIAGADLLTRCDDAEEIIAAEPEIIAHMNDDHSDAIAEYATGLLGASSEDGPWRMTGLDPSGADIHSSRGALRLKFPQTVRTPEEVRSVLVAMVNTARQAKQASK